ncbi:Thrombospondin type 3 repeat-containing protein, partial [Haloarchaeobius iranensis]
GGSGGDDGNTGGSGGDDEPDSDGDGVSDDEDNCVDTPNEGQLDTDGDGEGDACDPNDDGDAFTDEQDYCPKIASDEQQDKDFDGVGARCDEDEPLFDETDMTHYVSEYAETATFDLEYIYQSEPVDDRYSPNVVITGLDSEETKHVSLDSSVQARTEVATIDITEFRGEFIEVEIQTAPGEEMAVFTSRVVGDSDGDGLYDYWEEDPPVSQGLQGRSLDGLSAYNADSDQDGLQDGEEIDVEYGYVYPDGQLRGYYQERVITEQIANPAHENTDGGALDDGEEVNQGTNPSISERLTVGFSIVTLAQEQDGNLIPSFNEYGFRSDNTRDTYKTAHNDEYTSEPPLEIMKPGWVEGYNLEPSEYDYVRVTVNVFNQGNNIEQEDYATNYRFSLESQYSNAEIINPTGVIEPGTETVDLIIRDDNLPTGDAKWALLGEISMEAFVPPNSVIRNQNDAEWRQVSTQKPYSLNIDSRDLYSEEGVIELFSHRDDRTSRIVSAFVVGDSDDEAK